MGKNKASVEVVVCVDQSRQNSRNVITFLEILNKVFHISPWLGVEIPIDYKEGTNFFFFNLRQYEPALGQHTGNCSSGKQGDHEMINSL